MVAVLCVFSLPVPLKVIWESGREALLMAPDQELQQSVIKHIERAIEDVPISGHRIRMLKLGNVLSVTLHLQPADRTRCYGIIELDRIRCDIEDSLASLQLEAGVDILFIGDMKFAR